MICGDNVQVVSARTRRVGCAVHWCPQLHDAGGHVLGTNAAFVVCEYSPYVQDSLLLKFDSSSLSSLLSSSSSWSSSVSSAAAAASSSSSSTSSSSSSVVIVVISPSHHHHIIIVVVVVIIIIHHHRHQELFISCFLRDTLPIPPTPLSALIFRGNLAENGHHTAYAKGTAPCTACAHGDHCNDGLCVAAGTSQLQYSFFFQFCLLYPCGVF